MSDTRRDFLKKAALLSGAVTLSPLLPESIQRALAINHAEGSTWRDAEHIVILMQENRSFDHALGTLRGVRGYNDPRVIELPNRNLVWLQSNRKGETYAPFHLDIKNTKATWMDSLPHSWSNQTSARNDGKYDQWLDFKMNSLPEYAHMPLTMGFHTREDLPFYYALADAFTVCDQNFCSALTGTNPNRLYFWTGTVRPEQNEHSRAHVWNDDMDYGTLSWKTFPERLEEQGISWKCYQNEVAIDTGLRGEEDPWLSNFQDNPLEFFGQYNIHLYPRHVEELKNRQSALREEIDSLQKRIAASQEGAGLPAGDAHIDHLQKNLHEKQDELDKLKRQPGLAATGDLEGLSPFAQNLHRKAFDTNTGDPDHRLLEDLVYDDNGIERTMKVPKGDVLHSFRQDVLTGKLPTVSWLSAPENYSDHPSAPWYGAWYVSEALDILTQNPEIWKKTIFILAYDENDGYFDHVPPFTAPHPHRKDTGKVSPGIDTRVDYVTEAQEKERNGFPEGPFLRECSIGLGFRVPLIVASPWTRGGFVNSQVFDHTSTLQFLEVFLAHKTGAAIRETNISSWRRMVCGDLTSVFRPFNDERMPPSAFVNKDANLENINKAKFKKLPDDFKALTSAEIAVFNKRPQDSPFVTRQEPGTRPSCALPYCMLVNGSLLPDKKGFEMRMTNNDKIFGAATAGAPFNVYAPGNYAAAGKPGQMEPLRTWAYGVKPGDEISDVWPLTEFEGGRYHLRVYGPNGFYREFTGDANDPALGVELFYEANGSRLTGNASLRLKNNGAPCTVELLDHSYGGTYPATHMPAGDTAMIVLPLGKSHGWYDVSVQVGSFAQRFAGRVETGRDSISDPAMA
jgi:phospholipase C